MMDTVLGLDLAVSSSLLALESEMSITFSSEESASSSAGSLTATAPAFD
jgi:hypothetical protein